MKRSGMPLDTFELAHTIETRFCVNRMVTKTDPKRLGGGRDYDRKIVGCSPLGLHHCPTTTPSLGDEPKDGAFQTGNAPYGAKRITKTGLRPTA
jgi:hypothetical protein